MLYEVITTTLTGSAEFGVRSVSLNNQSGRFSEYQNIDEGLVGNVDINTQKDGRYLNLKIQSAGENDESIEFSGGQYGSYKYSLFFDEMRHNYSYDNRTFYSGIGSDTLSYSAVITSYSIHYTKLYDICTCQVHYVPTDRSRYPWHLFNREGVTIL